MNIKRCGSAYIIRIDKGEELVESLKDFAASEQIKLASVTGIGATNQVTIGWFETATQQYHSTNLTGDYEITNLTANLTIMNSEIYCHAHITLGGTDYQALGGHLNSAVISATFEGIVTVLDGEVDRELDPAIGLNLLKF